jgi:hypothetical protein
MEIENISYPDMNGISKWLDPEQRIPISERIIGKTIYWEIKRDGTNLKVFLDAAGQINVGTRGMTYAEPGTRNKFMAMPVQTTIYRALQDAYACNVDLVIFGELLMKGKSPARFELHEQDEFLVFDIWNDTIKEWMRADKRHDYCMRYGIPEVDTCAITYGWMNYDLNKILQERDAFLVQMKERGYEGVVGKVYLGAYVNFFKEKNEKPPRVKNVATDQDQTPELPDSEIYGAIDKAKADLGTSQFLDIKFAMPVIAKYVAHECEKHGCKCTRKLSSFYKKVCEGN